MKNPQKTSRPKAAALAVAPQKNTPLPLVRLTAFAILALWGVLAVAWLLWGRATTDASAMVPGAPAPAFALKDQTGRTHDSRDYQGRAIALAFLPNAEAASVQELRSLQKNLRQFDTLGVKVFGVAPIDAPAATRLHDGERLEFPILLDEGGQLAKQYKAHEKRASFVIGPDARILLPVTAVHLEDHGKQLAELTECCLDVKPLPASRLTGQPIADFTLPRVSDNAPESLYGDRKQKATVLFITSAECPCSARYDERMIALAQTYASKSVRFVAMNSSQNETLEEIKAYAQKAKYPFPVLKDKDNLQADRIEAKVTPEVFVMDAKNVLRYHGRIDDSRDPAEVAAHDLRNALDFLIAGKEPPRKEAPMFGCAIARKPGSASPSKPKLAPTAPPTK